MPVIFLKDIKCFPHNKTRVGNDYVYNLSIADKPVQDLLQLTSNTDVDVEVDEATTGEGLYSVGGCMCSGNGIDILGKGITGRGIEIIGSGIDTLGGQIVAVCKTSPSYRKKRIVRGLGIGSFFSKAKNSILNFGKKHIMPFLKSSAKTAVETAKRVGADVVENVADDVAKAGIQAIETKFGKNAGTTLATHGINALGKTAKSQATKYVDAQEKAKPYSKTEDQISKEIANRSRTILADLIAKNKSASAKPASAPSKPTPTKKGSGINDQLIS